MMVVRLWVKFALTGVGMKMQFMKMTLKKSEKSLDKAPEKS